MFRLHSDARVAKWLGHWDRSKVRTRLGRAARAWTSGGFDKWAAFRRSDRSFVGRGGLSRVELDGEPVVEAGWSLLPEHWGKGYATEIGREALRFGFEDLGLSQIMSFTHPENAPSIAVMERLCFDYQGMCVWEDAENVLYTITADRWM
ncbi:MAG: GNAT family N-acetyltransferase [Actinomycetota bacterium]|nr:GNAT family N-acetyltransferase [Actinomycetota bacterium]